MQDTFSGLMYIIHKSLSTLLRLSRSRSSCIVLDIMSLSTIHPNGALTEWRTVTTTMNTQLSACAQCIMTHAFCTPLMLHYFHTYNKLPLPNFIWRCNSFLWGFPAYFTCALVHDHRFQISFALSKTKQRCSYIQQQIDNIQKDSKSFYLVEIICTMTWYNGAEFLLNKFCQFSVSSGSRSAAMFTSIILIILCR